MDPLGFIYVAHCWPLVIRRKAGTLDVGRELPVARLKEWNVLVPHEPTGLSPVRLSIGSKPSASDIQKLKGKSRDTSGGRALRFMIVEE